MSGKVKGTRYYVKVSRGGCDTATPTCYYRPVPRISIALLALLFAAGCGYVYSGNWEDDPKNWKRAWGYSKPHDVVMPHSWYWRSPHWSREEAYFFQFRWHEELFNQFVANNNMSRSESSREASPDYCFQKPSWFVPKDASAYDIWRSPSVDAWLFRDAKTKELFFYACQL